MKLKDLSAYTKASNCTDLADIKVGESELIKAIDSCKVAPKSFYVRLYKLRLKYNQIIKNDINNI